MKGYTAGQLIEFTAQFTDDEGAPIDPTTVTFKYRVGAGAPITLTYTGVTTPGPGVVAKTGVGSYEAQVDTTGLDGAWVYQWQSTGIGQTVGSDSGVVEPSPL